MATHISNNNKLLKDWPIERKIYLEISEYLKNNLYENKIDLINKSMMNFFRVNRFSDGKPFYRILSPPPAFKINQKSLLIMDNILLPDYVPYTISLGEKFIYDECINQKQIEAFASTIDTITEKLHHYEFDIITDLRIKNNLMNFDDMHRIIHPKNIDNYTKGFLRQCLFASNDFFNKRKNIITARSDKGNVSVILHKQKYLELLSNHIDINITDLIYDRIYAQEPCYLKQKMAVETITSIYKAWFPKNKPSIDNTLGTLYTAKIYGTIKIHKEGCPIRPIIADYSNPLINIQKYIKKVLSLFITVDEFPFIIKNNDKICNYLESNPEFHKTHRLRTLDYDSMYTNIDLDIFYSIIYEEFDSYNIKNLYNIERYDFIRVIKLFFENFSFFTYGKDNIILQQRKGVPMGGVLSYHIAEIVTCRYIKKCINIIPRKYISVIFKYVDDIFIIGNTSYIDMHYKECLNEGFCNMPYKITDEDINGGIIYLDLYIKRFNNRMTYKWYEKPYSSQRSLDYFSAHPKAMKVNTYRNKYLNMKKCSITDNNTFIRDRLRQILCLNHFPDEFIKEILETL